MSRELDLDRKTVRKFACAAVAADLINTRETVLDRFKAFLHKRFNEGVTSAAVLLDEIRERGYLGSMPTLRRYLQPFRATMTARSDVDSGRSGRLRKPVRAPVPR